MPIEYQYELRMNALKGILANTTDPIALKRHLQSFVDEEKTLLSQLTPPKPRSQVLDIALRKLSARRSSWGSMFSDTTNASDTEDEKIEPMALDFGF